MKKVKNERGKNEMVAFGIGISLIAVGVVFIVWAGISNNRRTTTSVREELERAEGTNTDLAGTIATSELTTEQLAGTIGHINDTVGKLADTVGTDEEIFAEIRKQRIE